MAHKDGRVLARENEIKILRSLYRFGWLRTRDLAVLVWQRWKNRPESACPNLLQAEPTQSGLRMAQRTLKRMKSRRLVLDALAPDGSVIYTLAEAGVRVLSHLGLAAASGKDLIRGVSAGYFRHRCIANEIAIAAIVQGYRISTEREIARGLWLGKANGYGGKKPDVLIRHDKSAWWVEVEKSRKNTKEYANLVKWLSGVLRQSYHHGSLVMDGQGTTLEKLVFVCTPVFQNKLYKDLEKAGWGKRQIDGKVKFETSLYHFKDILFR
jgi:hypothetical protein